MKKRILIIEDHPETSEMMARMLELEGYEVLIASDGKMGIEKTLSEKPNLILLDVMLPGMSGFEVCEKLKSDPKTSQIPIIIVSIRAAEESIRKGKSLGANDYLPKPFDPAKLLELVKKYLG